MARPSKAIQNCTGHRTKSEIEFREKQEKSLKSGKNLKEFQSVKDDKVAHKEFLRVYGLMKIIDKNDNLYSAVINRYCTLLSECRKYEQLKSEYESSIEELSRDKSLIVEGYAPDSVTDTITLAQYYKLKQNFSKTLISLDSMISSHRKMMFDIEKENLMTVASGLRSIPKSPPTEEENPIAKLLAEADND